MTTFRNNMCELSDLERDILVNLKCPFTVATIFDRAFERRGNGDSPSSSANNCFQSSRLLGFEVLEWRRLLSPSIGMNLPCEVMKIKDEDISTSSNVMKLCNLNISYWI